MDLPEEGTTLAGRYRLLRNVGSGGMGAVYEAEHLRLRQRVAIKLLHPNLAARADIGARFEREARAATQLTSAHVARVTDVDVTPDGIAFMVMEFLPGHDLSKEIATRGALPIATAVGYVLQTCDAMIEAHALGIVHRDLKPGNLFLAEIGGRRIIKVLDFGISKVAADDDAPGLTSTFSALGTALYMSPEQVRSAKRVDARSDIWSLGVILFEALSGTTPFEGESATSVAASIVADPIPSLRALRPDVPEALEAVVYGALTKDREKRFQTMQSFATALAQFGPETSRPSFPIILDVESTSNPRISVSIPVLPTANTAPGWSAPPGSTTAKTLPRWALPAAVVGGFSTLLVIGIVALGPGSETPSGQPLRSAVRPAQAIVDGIERKAERGAPREIVTSVDQTPARPSRPSGTTRPKKPAPKSSSATAPTPKPTTNPARL